MATRYHLTDYNSFQDAISSIGSAKATLNISTNAVGFNGIVGDNFTLEFTNGGTISVLDGMILDLRSAISAAPHQKIFDLAGTGKVNIDNNKAVTEFFVNWWGVTGNGNTDDTLAMQSAFSAISNGQTLKMLPKQNFKITSQLILDRKFGILIDGCGSNAGYVDANIKPTFQFAGVDGTESVIKGINLYAIEFRGFRINTGTVAAGGAVRGIYCIKSAGGYPALPSHNLFTALHVAGYTNQRADQVCIEINNMGLGNNEHHVFTDMYLEGWGGTPNISSAKGIGILMADYQVKGVLIQGRNNFINLDTGILANGNYKSSGISAVNVKTLHHLAFSPEIVVIANEDNEGVIQHLVVDTANEVHVVDVRVANVRTDLGASSISVPVVSVQNAYNVTYDGAYFSGYLGASLGNYVFKSIGGSRLTLKGVSPTPGMNRRNLALGLNTFTTWTYEDKEGITLGHNNTTTKLSAKWFAGTSTTNYRGLVGIPGEYGDSGDSAIRPATVDALILGDGELQIDGLARPAFLTSILTGTYAANYNFLVLARDSGGNRTIPSRSLVFGGPVEWDTSNYVTFSWPKIIGAYDYQIVQVDPNDAYKFRLVATVLPTTSDPQVYTHQTTPSGPFISVFNDPANCPVSFYNETSGIRIMGAVYNLREIVFPDGATTPSVKRSNVFKTANSTATTITNFLQGKNAQVIQVVAGDSVTTIANSGSIKINSGTDYLMPFNSVSSFVLIGGVWYAK